MKRSHKKVLDLLNSGHWLKTNQHSFRTDLVYRGLKMVGTVRRSTLEEMRRIGLLTMGERQGVTAFVPVCFCDASGWPATSRIGKVCDECGGVVVDGEASKRHAIASV